jgi:hypothetical protein
MLFFTCVKYVGGQNSRETKMFNNDWRFHLGDVYQAKEKDYNDSEWRMLNIPHDWSIELNFDKKYASSTAYLPGGIGWYRKSFIVPAEWRGKSIKILFDGIYNNSEVWINGHYLGKRPNGYISFIYDITPYLFFGEENIISVRVDRTKFADSRWYTGSGIYRNVWLIVTSKIHVAQWGTTIVTPKVLSGEALVSISTKVINENKSNEPIKIVYTVIDNNNNIVTNSEFSANLNDSLSTLKHQLSLKKPQLWNIENPVMYKLKTTIISDNKIIDETTEPFGVRTIKFDPDRGFFLNDKNVKIKGVCLHHDGGCVGAAVPVKIWEIRLEKLKAAGCNAIRTSHNPVAPEFLDLCDKMGFLVMDEAFDEWEYPKRKWYDGWNNSMAGYDGYSSYFNEWAVKDLSDMIERDKNHPSIIMWSIGNEIDYANDPYGDKNDRNYDFSKPDPMRMIDIAKKLKSVILYIDTTRPVTMALANVRNSISIGLPDILDITGYNYTESRYEEDHKKFPSRVIYGSENPHTYSSWLITKKNDYISSQFLWTGVDYLGEAGKFPFRSAYSGLLDLTNNEKPIYYWRQSMWSEKPVLSIAARKKKVNDITTEDPMRKLAWFVNEVEEKWHWNYNIGDTVLVVAYSNCDEVELFINGKSKGKKVYNEQYSCFWWYVPFEAGEVKAIGYKQGQKNNLVASLKTVYEPKTISVTSDTKEIKADGHDVAIIEVKLLDENNNCSYLAKNKIEFEVTGEGKIIGTDNGDAACLDNFKLPWRKVHNGRCIAIIQSTEKPGKIIVKAKSEGLPDSFVEIISK